MSFSNLSIRPIRPEQTYPLRHAVLWPDKPFDYIKLANDAEGQHFGAFVGDELVAVISLFVHEKTARFRKFATHPDFQCRGIGTQLLHRVMAEAEQRGAHTLWCDARLDSADFYRKFGMQPEGAIFYKGPIPYAKMSRTLPG